jgi:hypothetical protein
MAEIVWEHLGQKNSGQSVSTVDAVHDCCCTPCPRRVYSAIYAGVRREEEECAGVGCAGVEYRCRMRAWGVKRWRV